jgi:parallel beta-helix repeat protein
MAEQKAAAFMSYVHMDDAHGHVTNFHKNLNREVSMAVGYEFPIFLDREDIGAGQNWARRIEEAVDEALFFIPILTPGFFNSEYCRAELRRFLARERKLGRDDLIFPIYFIDARVLNEEALRARDDLALVIASRQYADWRNLRHEPFTNPLVGRTLEKLAMQIRDALPTVAPQRQPPAAPALQPSETQQASAPAEESSAKSAATQPTKVEPLTRVVDPMHRGDFATISEAIAKSAPGTRILVRPGLYLEGLVIDKPLEVIGDGEPGEVVVQASGENVLLFQTTMGRVSNLTLRQMGGGKWFTVDIAQGRLELEDCDITSQSLSCIAIHNGADPRLRRNRIHDGKETGVAVYENGLGTLEDNDIFANGLGGVEIKSGGNPTLRRNRIHDGKQGGVLINKGGLGTLEDNDIFSNAYAGVQIKLGGNPTLRRNRIHDGKQCGVYVNDSGLGTLEDNDIFGNASVGVEIKDGGNPILRNNRINKNAYEAIWIHKGGSGTFEGNDLRDNAKGAWDIAAECAANVKRFNNQE